MKRYYSIFLLSFFLGACQDSLKEGFGYLQFSSVELNKTVIPTSKATGETTEKIALDLIRDGEVMNGVSMKQVQEWLGHSDFSTTANIYSHLDYASKVSSAEAMLNGLGMGSNPGNDT